MNSARRLHPPDPAALDREPGHLASLDDVDAERTRGAGKAPRHRIVPGRAGPTLIESAEHRMMAVKVDERDLGFDLLARQELRSRSRSDGWRYHDGGSRAFRARCGRGKPVPRCENIKL